MVSINGTQHRHVPAGRPSKTEANHLPLRGESDLSVGHLARDHPELGNTDAGAPNAVGKAAAVIAKMTFDARAILATPPSPKHRRYHGHRHDRTGRERR